MGYDGLPSPGTNESAEITIAVTGAIDPNAFKEFKRRLKEYLDTLAKLDGGKGCTWTRVSIRKTK
jgi:hypothetical protein